HSVSRGRSVITAHVQCGPAGKHCTDRELPTVVLDDRDLGDYCAALGAVIVYNAQVFSANCQPGTTVRNDVAELCAPDLQVLIRDHDSVRTSLINGDVQKVAVAHEVRHVPVHW